MEKENARIQEYVNALTSFELNMIARDKSKLTQ